MLYPWSSKTDPTIWLVLTLALQIRRKIGELHVVVLLVPIMVGSVLRMHVVALQGYSGTALV